MAAIPRSQLDTDLTTLVNDVNKIQATENSNQALIQKLAAEVTALIGLVQSGAGLDFTSEDTQVDSLDTTVQGIATAQAADTAALNAAIASAVAVTGS
jgi:hypothetical protein